MMLRISGALLLLALAAETVAAGDIYGRLEDASGDGVHESLLWAVGSGSNTAGQLDSALSWVGDYRLENLAAGTYNIAANAHGAMRHVFVYGVNVPGSGNVNLDIRHTAAMEARGFTALDTASEAGQTFVANGPWLWTVTAYSATGGHTVRMTVHEGGPAGAQVGPAIEKTIGTLYPTFFHWNRGEVPLVVGDTYYIRIARTDGPSWLPVQSILWDPFPRGMAYLEGEPQPNYDLFMRVVCIDDGMIYDADTNSGYRTDTQTVLHQSFKAGGEELRYADFMLATSGGPFLMRVSLHESLNGPQIGPTKRVNMGANLPNGVVWGPGEAPVTPGTTYFLRVAREDGQPFGIYGTDNDYPDGQLYQDGNPVNADADFVVLCKAPELPDIALSNVQAGNITGLSARITWTTHVAANGFVEYWETADPFPPQSPLETTPTTAHDVTLVGLEPGTTYSYRAKSWRSGYDLGESAVLQFTTPSTTGQLAGTVRNLGGTGIGSAHLTLMPGDFQSTSNSGGAYQFAVPPGTYELTVDALGYEDFNAGSVVVTANNTTTRDVTLTGAPNLLANGGFESGLTGWTEFGQFDDALSGGTFAVPARSGNMFAGSVSNYGFKNGGIYQTVSVDPNGVYVLRGHLFTEAFKNDGATPQDGLAQGRLGFDPNGGTDPGAPSVLWSDWKFTAERYLPMELTAAAPGGSLTVFLQTRHLSWWDIPQWWKAGFDDISLSESTTVTTGSVAGTVTSLQSGAPLEGALVEVVGTAWSAVTNDQGRYSISGLDPGNWQVRASKDGYDPVTQAANIQVGQVTTVNLALPGEGLPLALINPSFEMGDLTGWEWYSIEGSPPDGVWGPGEWYADMTPYHQDKALMVATNWGVKMGSLYQKIGAVKGATYDARCYIRTFQSGGGDGDVRGRIGLDPTGGTDPTAGTVIWSQEYPSPGTWREITLEDITATGTEITVFCSVAMSYAREWQILAMDHFQLEVEGGIPTPTPTPMPTPTPEPPARAWIQVR